MRSGLRIPEIIVGVLLTVAVFGIGVTFSHIRPPSGTEDSLWSWLTKDASGAFTGLQVLVAFGQALLFVWQLRIMQETTVATTRNADALINAQRAYLWPGFGRAGQHPDGGWVYFLTILNTGPTPGIMQRIYFALVSEEDYEAGRVQYSEVLHNDVITPNRPGSEYPTLQFRVRDNDVISCGYVIFKDMFENTHKQGWKHRLSHHAYVSVPLQGCYSDPPVEYPVTRRI
jgi:hypothetical protein